MARIKSYIQSEASAENQRIYQARKAKAQRWLWKRMKSDEDLIPVFNQLIAEFNSEQSEKVTKSGML